MPERRRAPDRRRLPTWYMITGPTQGPNVVAANTCAGFPSGANSCYVLTDRGTYDYLASGTDPAGSIPNLKIVTSDDSASAPGGSVRADQLLPRLHHQPGASRTSRSTCPAAQALLNLLTSPALQSQLKTYLADTERPGWPSVRRRRVTGIIIEQGLPEHRRGRAVRDGHRDADERRARLSGPVRQDRLDRRDPGRRSGSGRRAATTNSSGGFSITSGRRRVAPTRSRRGRSRRSRCGAQPCVRRPPVARARRVHRQDDRSSAIAISNATVIGGWSSPDGSSISPAAPDANANVTILTRRQGSTGAFTQVGAAASRAVGLFGAVAALRPGSGSSRPPTLIRDRCSRRRAARST